MGAAVTDWDASAYPVLDAPPGAGDGSLTDAWRCQSAIPANGPLCVEQRLLLFLRAFADRCHVGDACKAAGLSRMQVAAWRKADAEFAGLYLEAEQIGVSALEDEATRRAFQGTDKPVYHQGVEVGAVREYSDSLATFLLKAHKPDRYRERQDIALSGTIDIVDAMMAARSRAGLGK
jgi:hypothetical protein